MTVVIDDGSNWDSWLKAREDYVTASEAASLFGWSYTSRPMLAKLKAGVRPSDSEAIGALGQVQAGKAFEDGVITWFTLDGLHGSVVRNKALLARGNGVRLAATPDAIIDGLPCEAKFVGESARKNWHIESSRNGENGKFRTLARKYCIPVEADVVWPTENDVVGKFADPQDPASKWTLSRVIQKRLIKEELGSLCAPLSYWLQLQVQMFVLDKRAGWLVAAVGGTCLYSMRFERNEEVLGRLVSEVPVFFAEVERLRRGKAVDSYEQSRIVIAEGGLL